MTKKPHGLTTHGMSNTLIYRRWAGMLDRCRNKSNPSYKNYGGRGIVVCEAWHQFEQFFADMGDVPKGMTLERVDVNGPYSPENCVWETRRAQVRNRRVTRVATLNGVTKSVAEWCEELGISYLLIQSRIKRGRTPEESFNFTPLPKGNRYTLVGARNA